MKYKILKTIAIIYGIVGWFILVKDFDPIGIGFMLIFFSKLFKKKILQFIGMVVLPTGGIVGIAIFLTVLSEKIFEYINEKELEKKQAETLFENGFN